MDQVALFAPQALRVLIVEDSEDDAALLCSELSEAGRPHSYRRVDSESAMREALRQADWDIVISDHTMPRFSSQEALEVLKQSDKDIPFIIYSGTISEQTAIAALRKGVHDCVLKGNFARLVPSIERELRNAAVRREKQNAEAHVYRLAYCDELTGLPNRNLFVEKVNQALAEPGAGGAVYILNLDRFMRVNDTFGYATGDAVIRQVAQRLQGCLEGGAVLARFRGDDFAVFQHDRDDAQAVQQTADRVMGAFVAPFVHDNLEFYMTASMGVCRYPADGADADTLLRNAESALALAKKLWGNNYKYYVRELAEASAQRLALENALRRAVERNELELHYQPISAIGSGAVVGAEALVRWRHPELGLLTPDKFIPLADETGLIIGIGAWVLREACGQMRAWHNLGLADLTISVNVSAVQFAQPHLLGQVAEVLRETGLPPACIELEITESVLMRDVESTINTLRALKEMGVRIAVDDFGTGYSSLSYLKRFPIDLLKIDKSFVRDMAGGPDGSAIVAAITALAKSLKLETQAEGVETAKQLAYLRDLRCDRMQGYLLSRPLTPQKMQEFLFPASSLSDFDAVFLQAVLR